MFGNQVLHFLFHHKSQLFFRTIHQAHVTLRSIKRRPELRPPAEKLSCHLSGRKSIRNAFETMVSCLELHQAGKKLSGSILMVGDTLSILDRQINLFRHIC